jgi:hypothetical protein
MGSVAKYAAVVVGGFLVSALGTVGVGCAHRPSGEDGTVASSPATASSALDGGPTFVPGDVQKLYARELAALPVTKVSAGKLTGEIESAGAPVVEQDDNSIRFTFALGTQSPIKCFVYPKPIPVGVQLLKLVRAIEGVDVRLVRPTDVVVIGDHAALYLEVQYLAKTGKGAALGELKLMAFGHATTPLVCLHDELGYNAAFKRITAGFASSLKLVGGELRIPTFIEISVESVNSHPIGFTRSVVLPNDKGGSREISTTTSLTPRSERDVATLDSTRVTTWDARGRVVEISYGSQQGEDVADDVTLKLVFGHEYSYEGTHLGKEVAGKIKTKNPRGFLSDVESARDVLKLLGDKGAAPELRTEEYHPDLDPTAPIETVMRLSSRKDRTVTVTLGKLQMTASVDDKGLMDKVEMPVGPVTVAISRALIRGSL